MRERRTAAQHGCISAAIGSPPGRLRGLPFVLRRRFAGGAPADVAGAHMQLDAAVQSALNVMPSNEDASNSFSLFGLLNKAQTAMGKALLKVGAG